MLLTWMTILSVVIGSSALYGAEKRCHGEKFTFPRMYSPPRFRDKMYFTPSKGGSKRVVMNEGVIHDTRISNSTNKVYMADLTESDTGTFSVTHNLYSGMALDAIKLVVSDCAEPVIESYGETHYASVPQQTEYVEYSPRLSDPVVLLWNRSDPQTNQGDKRQVRRGFLKIPSITQTDNGYYSFWEKDRKLLSRILLTVEGKHSKMKKHAGEELIIRYPSANSVWTVSAILEEGRKNIVLVNAGTLVTESDPDAEQFFDRVQPLSDGVKFIVLETSDSGTYEFKDEQNNLGLTVLLEVKIAPPSTMVIVFFIAGIIVTAIICFCCVRRCRRKKMYSNRGQAAHQTAAALPVYHHDGNYSSPPSYTVAHAPDQSHQPVNSGVSRETAAFSSEPPFSPLRSQEATPAPTFSPDYLSSDPGPRFELKGLNAPFASPLSSNSTVTDVYSSDKLNFL